MRIQYYYYWGVTLMIFGVAQICNAQPFVTVTSSCVSNGLFEYELCLWNDPFFKQVDFYGFLLPEGSNGVPSGPDLPGWTNYVAGAAVWNCQSTNVLRPQVARFRLQTPHASFRKGVGIFACSALTQDQYISPYVSGSMTMYSYVDCLVPCPNEEADGSLSAMTASFQVFPDIKIDRLVSISNRVHGVTVSWGMPSTMILQSSSNLANWTNLSYFLVDTPSTTWTSSAPLDVDGAKFFRVLLYSTEHHPELIH